MSYNNSQKRSQNILITINHGLSSRYILRSDLINDLISSSNIKIIIAVADSNSFSDLISQFKGRLSIVRSPKIINGSSIKEKIYKYIKLIQNFGIPNHRVYDAIWIKRKLFAESSNYSSIKKIFVLTFSRIHCHSYIFRRILRKLTYYITKDLRFIQLLKESKIDKVMLDGLTSLWPNNSYWISASKNLGINTTTLITNWDHPTTRGYESINANQYLVWGKSMRDEMIKYHDIKPKKVDITGSVIFDLYSNPSFILSDNQINSIYKRNIPKTYVLFLTNSPYYPHNLKLVKYIRNQLRKDITLVIRLHPLYLDDFAKNEFLKHKEYDKANSNLIYIYPNSLNNSMSADMSYEEIQLSASLVANARVRN